MTRRSITRTLRLGGQQFATPLVIPSFSSRAKPPTSLADFLTTTLESIVGPILVSAYDVENARSNGARVDVVAEIVKASPSFVLLDSGGYEALWNDKAVKAGLIKEDRVPAWSRNDHAGVLAKWPNDLPLLAVTFDVPDEQPELDKQIDAAEELAARFPNHSIEMLVKPPRGSFDLVELEGLAPRLAQFPIIGVTEDEIGTSMADRLRFLAAFRDILDNTGASVPIHIFGGLDPMMTPLYFAAGADVFDGLSWLRYAYEGHMGIYDKSHVATEYPLESQDEQVWSMRRRNIERLVDLQLALVRFAKSGDFAVFAETGGRIAAAWDKCLVPG